MKLNRRNLFGMFAGISALPLAAKVAREIPRIPTREAPSREFPDPKEWFERQARLIMYQVAVLLGPRVAFLQVDNGPARGNDVLNIPMIPGSVCGPNGHDQFLGNVQVEYGWHIEAQAEVDDVDAMGAHHFFPMCLAIAEKMTECAEGGALVMAPIAPMRISSSDHPPIEFEGNPDHVRNLAEGGLKIRVEFGYDPKSLKQLIDLQALYGVMPLGAMIDGRFDSKSILRAYHTRDQIAETLRDSISSSLVSDVRGVMPRARGI